MYGVIGLFIFIYLIRSVRNKPSEGTYQAPALVDISGRRIFLWIFFGVGYVCYFWFITTLPHIKLFLFPLFIFLLFPISVFFWSGSWLAWRIALPLRSIMLCRFFFWFSTLAREPDLKGFALFVKAYVGHLPAAPADGAISKKRFKILRKKIEPRLPVIDAWATCSEALAAEVSGDGARADRIMAAFDCLPKSASLPPFVKKYVFEELAWWSARRNNWRSVARRARLAKGRGALLLRVLARNHTDRAVHPLIFWSLWLISPGRIAHWRILRESSGVLSRAKEKNGSTVLPQQPGLLHLHLLAVAASGRRITPSELVVLAREWSKRLIGDGAARLRARSLELGVRDVSSAVNTVHESVLQEMEVLAAESDGWLSAAGDDPSGLLQELSQRLCDSLLEDVERTAAFFALNEPETLGPLPEEWEHWLSFREAVERLEQHAGTETMRTAWYGTARLTAWNWPCRIFNNSGPQGCWIAYMMFEWAASTAAKLGDEEAAEVNRDNVKLVVKSLKNNREMYSS
jgi:hypothetical protein